MQMKACRDVITQKTVLLLVRRDDILLFRQKPREFLVKGAWLSLGISLTKTKQHTCILYIRPDSFKLQMKVTEMHDADIMT